MNRDLKLVN